MGELTWNPLLPPPLVVAGAAGLAGLALWVAWRARLSRPLWMNASALVLRTMALACAVVLILRPETVRRESHLRGKPLRVLVDNTQSLHLRDTEGGPTRAERGRPMLAALLAGAAARGWEVQAQDAGERLEARDPRDETLRGEAPSSPLGERLAEALAWTGPGEPGAAGRRPAGPPAAVVFFTDGVVNRGRSLAEGAIPLGARGVPLYGVLLGEDHPLPPDAAVAGLTVRREETAAPAPETEAPAARSGQRVVAEARAQLLAGGPSLSGPLADVVARLSVAGPLGAEAAEFKEVEALRHRLREAPAFTPVRLAFTPAAPGFYRLRLALDALPGERQLANNVAYGSLEVLPPRRRVVYVCSRLGHDYRHLKVLFANWDGPPVEVVADFVKAAPEAAGTLAQSPAEELLARWLEEGVASPARGGSAMLTAGGALIWEEPDPARLTPRTQAKLRAALQSGALGALWVVNEPAEALARRLNGTPLDDAFLFRGPASSSGTAEAPPGTPVPAGGTAEPPPVKATPVAREHPATRWAFAAPSGADPFEQALAPVAAWGEWPGPSAGVTSSTPSTFVPREGVTVLLQSDARPLLAVGQVGAGRVALLATGESWRWLAPLKAVPGREAGPRVAGELWRHAVEWVAGATGRPDPPVRIYLAKDNWDLGEPLRARVAVRVAGAAEDAKVEYDLTRLPAGAAVPAPSWLPFSGDAPGGAWAGETLPSGEVARLRVFSGAVGAPTKEGEWLLRARARRPPAVSRGEPDGAEIGADRVQFCVQGSALEERSVRPDGAALAAAVEAAAARSPGGSALGGHKGRVLPPDPAQVPQLLEELADLLQPEEIVQVARAPAVSVSALLGLLVLALAVDVWLRRA